jgi:hypothetical protein
MLSSTHDYNTFWDFEFYYLVDLYPVDRTWAVVSWIDDVTLHLIPQNLHDQTTRNHHNIEIIAWEECSTNFSLE